MAPFNGQIYLKDVTSLLLCKYSAVDLLLKFDLECFIFDNNISISKNIYKQ
jgi:hypothetical protein